MGVELVPKLEKIDSSIFLQYKNKNKLSAKIFHLLRVKKCAVKAQVFTLEYESKHQEETFRSNGKLQLALTQQNPKQKLFRLHRKIADRRGL